MPTTIKVSSLGFVDLDYSVPSTVEEYNALAPKRNNPILEDAIDNIIKHKVLSQFRNKFLDAVEVKYKDIPGSARQNFGTEKTPKWEPDMPYFNRLIALVVASEGGSASDAGAVAAVIAQLRELAQTTLSAQVFNVAEREPSTASPSVAKMYTEWADEAFSKGVQEKLLGFLNKACGSTLAFVGDDSADKATLAKAIATNEKRKRDLAAAATKAELFGL